MKNEKLGSVSEQFLNSENDDSYAGRGNLNQKRSFLVFSF